MNEELLKKNYEGYNTNYTFGGLDSIYGKKDIELTDIDVIKLVIDKKEIYKIRDNLKVVQYDLKKIVA